MPLMLRCEHGQKDLVGSGQRLLQGLFYGSLSKEIVKGIYVCGEMFCDFSKTYGCVCSDSRLLIALCFC